MNLDSIKIIKEPSENLPFVVCDKPSGIPSAPLSAEDCENALSYVCKLFPSCNNVMGKKSIEKGLIHRIDTVTRGLLLVAQNQSFYDYMLSLQDKEGFSKKYRALCFMEKQFKAGEDFSITSYFRPYGEGHKMVKPVFENEGGYAIKKIGKKVLYTTKVKILSVNQADNSCEVECEIVKGFRHQVRSHLSECGLPVFNDPLYGKGHKKNPLSSKVFFEATGICFEYPKGDLNSYEIAPTWT